MSPFALFVTINIFLIFAGVISAIILSIKSMGMSPSAERSRTRAAAFWSVFWPVFILLAVSGARALMDASRLI